MQRWSIGPGFRGTVALALACSIAACGDDTLGEPSTGGLVLVVSTTGGDVDTDGYLVSVDGGAAVRVSEGTTTLADLDPGEYQVVVSDIADNCVLDGGNQRSVTIRPDEITEASLDVTCTAYRGSMRVEVLSTGWDVDADGYMLLVDGIESDPLASTSVHTVAAVEPVEHTVALANVAPNCAVVIPRVRTVTVDSLQETGVAFRVFCAAASGPTAEQIFLSTCCGLLRVSSDGSGAELLPSSPSILDYPTWSPDRTRLAVSLYDPPRDEFAGTLWSVPVNGAAPSRIGALAGIEDPSWSPDGSQLVYRARRPDVGLHVIGADGSGDLRITTDEEDLMPAWSPDGSRIAFLRVSASPWQIHTVRPDGSELTALPTVGTGTPLAPTWSPDGTRIAFMNYGPGEVLWVMNDDGTGLTRLTPLDFEAFENPTWSPTGDRLAMIARRGTEEGLWTVRSDGSELTFVLPTTGGRPSWGR